MNEKEKKQMENVGEKMYDRSDYNGKTQLEKGMAVTHEQASDSYMEGTVDGRINQVDEQGELKSHEGEEIQKRGFNK